MEHGVARVPASWTSPPKAGGARDCTCWARLKLKAEKQVMDEAKEKNAASRRGTRKQQVV